MLAVGIIGAFIVRFRPDGMLPTMLAMAFAQAVVTVIALITGMQHAPGSSVFEILGVNGFFIILFVVSALLFGYATKEQEGNSVNK